MPRPDKGASARGRIADGRDMFRAETASSRAALRAGLAVLASFAHIAAHGDTTVSASTTSRDTGISAPSRVSSALRYDVDYPVIAYGERATRNSIARLQARLDSGEAKLKFQPPRGYLESVLSELGIDASSQVAVFSKTSLQSAIIRAATPRAIYFNDDTYVAWIKDTPFLEIATVDSEKGPVFYILPNGQSAGPRFERESLRCLSCHDTFGMSGGGVPRLLVLSTMVSVNGEALTRFPGKETTDRTPIRDRWAGWYVTGRHGDQEHLGNILIERPEQLANLEKVRRGNLDSLGGLFDVGPYLTDKSDIVALMVFEHQTDVQNYITRANFKARSMLARQGYTGGPEPSWSSLSSAAQRSLRALLEPLVRTMLFVDAAEITSRITSSSGFDEWFQAQGPRDPRGRSLRDLDLTTRLFKHRLSYVVYSEAFDGLPRPAREYVYTRFADILSGKDQSATFSHLTADERSELLEILRATKPPFDQFIRSGV